MTSEWHWYRESLLRRLGYAAAAERRRESEPPVAVPWDKWRGELLARTTWKSVRSWAASLEGEISSRAGGAHPGRMFAAPLREYASRLSAHDGRPRELVLAEDDFEAPDVTLPDCDPELATHLRLLRRPARERAREWMDEARVAWSGWAPALDRGLFTVTYDAAWSPCKHDAVVHGLLNERLPPQDGTALACWDRDGAIALAPTSLVRTRLPELLSEGSASDVFVLPIGPDAGSWAISYFHHDWLEIGMLKGLWPHRARVSGCP